ncbi:hypothetical protein [Epilithonimonas sp. UC225_85]|uniref:hypothetical protein n=1 Tax=Epilithonimonas sp. UC225_85 TaxID=3350167 RepID=UPI0036D3E144
MCKFEINEFEAVQGKQKFFDLKIDGLSQYNEFKEIIERDYQSMKTEMLTMFSYMNLVSNLHTLPRTKFNEITPQKETIKEYELKSKHLRIYFFHYENTGKIITVWGFKNNQKEDILKFRRIKKEFIQNYKNETRRITKK